MSDTSQRVGHVRAPSKVVTAVALLDGSITLSVLLLWVALLGLAEPALMAFILVTRSFILVVHTARMLRPVRRYSKALAAEQTIGDPTLLATDRVLQSLIPRLSRAAAASWAIAIAIILITAAARHQLPNAELLVASILGIVIVITSPVALFHPVQGILRPVQHELGLLLLRRGIHSERPPSSLAKQLAAMNLITIMALLSTGAAVGIELRIAQRRSEALGAQLRLVEIAARTQDFSEVRVLATPDLPITLGVDPNAAPAQLATLVSTYDRRREQVLAAAALGDGRWAVAGAEPDEQLGLLSAFIAVFFISTMLPTLYNSRMFGRSVIAPLEQLDATTRELVDVGQLALVARIVPLRNDEIGALAQTFNEMLDNFDELARAAQAVADGDLSATVNRPGNLPDAYRAMLTTLRAMVVGLQDTARGISAAVTELGSVISVQNQAASEQATSAREVTRTTQSLAHAAAQISDAAGSVQNDADQGVSMAGTTALQIAQLQTQTHGINELLELIREVADRSDLLALNGALEAVRAGEAGRGFGIVAAEMRRLAERVNGAVNDIHQRVAGIESSVSKTVEATERSRELAQSTAAAARDINAALTQHEARSAQTVALAQQVVDTLGSFRQAGEQTQSTADGLSSHAQELERILRHFQLE